MFEKLGAFFSAFRAGEALANADAWKTGQISATALGAFLLALVHIAGVYGISIPVTEQAADAVGAGIIALVNVVLSLTTSANHGLLPRNKTVRQTGNRPN